MPPKKRAAPSSPPPESQSKRPRTTRSKPSTEPPPPPPLPPSRRRKPSIDFDTFKPITPRPRKTYGRNTRTTVPEPIPEPTSPSVYDIPENDEDHLATPVVTRGGKKRVVTKKKKDVDLEADELATSPVVTVAAPVQRKGRGAKRGEIVVLEEAPVEETADEIEVAPVRRGRRNQEPVVEKRGGLDGSFKENEGYGEDVPQEAKATRARRGKTLEESTEVPTTTTTNTTKKRKGRKKPLASQTEEVVNVEPEVDSVVEVQPEALEEEIVEQVPAAPRTPKRRNKSKRKAAPPPPEEPEEATQEDTHAEEEEEEGRQMALQATPTHKGRRSSGGSALKLSAQEGDLPDTPTSNRRRSKRFNTPDGLDVEAEEAVEAEERAEELANASNVSLKKRLESAGKGTPKKKNTPKSSEKRIRLSLDNVITEKAVNMLKEHVMAKLCGKPQERRVENLVGLEDEYRKVYQLLEQTVVAGEGNSMLIVGSRGVGKTALIETALTELTAEHPSEFLTVRLNSFFQTDDKLASREIWRQLGVNMDLEESSGIDGIQPKTSNFSDTLQSILAVLSHPTEHAPSDSLPAEDQTAISVVFILDEFDGFVTHPRQTLLYNLFDIAQARKAPIAVLGLTSRIDVVESLEKRVKSRFSHRSIHLKLPSSLELFWTTCRSLLEIDLEALDQTGSLRDNEREYFEQWNTHLDTLYDESHPFRTSIRSLYATSKSYTAFANAFLIPISDLTPSNPFLDPPSTPTLSSHLLTPPQSPLDLLQTLSDLDLSLLIAAARLEIRTSSDQINFLMAYDEYVTLNADLRIQGGTGINAKIWGKEVAGEGWERLGACGLLREAGGVTGGMGREGKMWRVEVGLRDIGRVVGGRGASWKRWCREI